ncbi:MAG: hypothetical protein EBR02_02195 [Alphaproteobacteria bacterium]|nr:hypothetical protein [Alphaproteobacteria bacterium]
MIMKKYFRLFFVAVSSMLTLWAGWSYYVFYWRWLPCFNEEGRCFDEASGAVYFQQAGIVYGSVALISFIALFFSLLSIKRKRA